MDHAFAVRGFEAQTNLADDVAGLAGGKFALLREEGLQIPAFHVVHGDELDVARRADVEDADDVAVGDETGQDQFLLEALQNVGIVGQFAADDFQGDDAVQLAVHGLVDRAHAAFAEHLQDFVAVG